jgi:hypothetical protein
MHLGRQEKREKNESDNLRMRNRDYDPGGWELRPLRIHIPEWNVTVAD